MRLLTLLLLLAVAPAQAADWPTRPVTIVVPNAPGGFTDIMARLAGQVMSRKFGLPFIIDNRAGGAGVIGAGYVAHAQPDGYTFLYSSPSTILTQPMLQDVSYDPASLMPISILGSLPFILGIRSSLPPKTLKEFVAYAKANPGKLNYASAGVGGIGYLVNELFMKTAGIDGVHVAYKSAAPATAALLTGEVDMYFGGSPELIQHKASDRIRLLATSGAARFADLPAVPTVGETYPGFAISTWEGFMAPKGTPKEIIDAMTQATVEAAKDPTVMARFAALGITPDGSTQQQFIDTVNRDRLFYGNAIKAAGIRTKASAK